MGSLLLIGLVLGGCGRDHVAPLAQGHDAIVLGAMVLESQTPRPIPGTVSFSMADHVYVAHTNVGGLFSIVLPPGTYTVRGTSPDFEGGTRRCSGGTVTVISSGPNTVPVACMGF